MTQDLVFDPLVEQLKGIEIRYVLGPPKIGENDGLKIRAGFIPKKSRTKEKGSFIISPGRTEYIEKYAETILALNARGFNVLIIDHRGQGLSDRLGKEYWHGDIDDFDNAGIHLGNAIEEFKDKLPKPHFIISHSMGGMIVLNGLIKNYFGEIKAAIFNAPMWSIKPSPLAKQLVFGLCKAGFKGKTAPTLNVKWSPNDFFTNDVSHDKVRFARNNALMLANPRLQLGGPTNAWVKSSYDIFKNFTQENLEKIKIKTLVLQAGKETLVDNEGQEKIAKMLGNAKIVKIENAKHEMLVEIDEIRTKVWQIIDDFLQEVESL